MRKPILEVLALLIILSTISIALAQTSSDTSGPATACNGNVPYTGNAGRYAAWNGQCNGARQADGSGGIGQGCCELACGADSQCDEQYAGQGNCTSTCKYQSVETCANEFSSAYGNKLCHGDVNVDDCNWPSGTESVSTREISSGQNSMWVINFTSAAAVDVNVFVVYGRIVSVTQPDWKPYAGYIKPGVCTPDSNETTCVPQLLGTHNYCSFRTGSDPLMLSLPNPSTITTSNPARGFWPLPLSNTTHSASITVNITDEAQRRGLPVILYYQFNKALTGGNYSSWCMPDTACKANECGIYAGCFEYATSANVVLCVKNQSLSAPVVIAACGHHAWESSIWDKINLTAPPTTSTTTTAIQALTCSACEVGGSCTCTMSGCNAGMWIVKNITHPPAMETKTFNLPPTSISFTPTAVGSLEVIVSCDNPSQPSMKTTVDVTGSMLSCASCYAKSECECQISGCNNGTFIAMQGSVAIKALTIPPVVSSIKFTPNSTETVTITGNCFNPLRGPTVLNVYPLPSTSTSTSTSTSISTTTTISDCPYDCCVGESQYVDKVCPEGQECINNKCEGGTDYSSIILILLALLLLIVVPFLIYRYFIRKKSKEGFSELYKKWSGRRKY